MREIRDFIVFLLLLHQELEFLCKNSCKNAIYLIIISFLGLWINIKTFMLSVKCVKYNGKFRNCLEIWQHLK